MWSLPGWETEALAARAVCSTALCLRNAASQPLRSLPMYSTLPVGRWQKPGGCQIINTWRCPTPSPTSPRNSSTSVPATSCRKSSTSSWGSTYRTRGSHLNSQAEGAFLSVWLLNSQRTHPLVCRSLPHRGHVGKLRVDPLQPIGLHEGGKPLPADANERLAVGWQLSALDIGDRPRTFQACATEWQAPPASVLAGQHARPTAAARQFPSRL